MSLKYRAEIDGLRAVAVVSVILFHAGFERFSGGYLGVDIFFVISGYLISSIIFTEMDSNTFSLFRFYVRRIKRIVPLVLFVMLVFFVVFWKVMLPWDFENYGAEVVATTGFSNNIFHFVTSGNYWGTESEFKALLHTWSLGVEEQFYIVFPLIILGISRLRNHQQFVVLAFLFFVSSCLFVMFARKSEMLVFFISPFRAWELLAGVLLAKLPFRNIDGGICLQMISLLGIAIIAITILAADGGNAVATVHNFCVVLGAMMVIVTSARDTIVGQVLSCRPLVWIGLISFSLYLWHQPIFVAFRLLSITEPSPIEYMPCILLCCVLSFMSWHFVEKFFRFRWEVSEKVFLISVASCATALMMFGFYVYNSAGVSTRWTDYDLGHNASSRNANVVFNNSVAEKFSVEIFPENGLENVLVIGNSFARDFLNAADINGFFGKQNLAYSDEVIQQCLDSGDLFGVSRRLSRLLHSANFIIFPSGDFDAECAQHDIEILERPNNASVIIVGTKNFGWSTSANMILAEREGFDVRVPVISRELAASARQEYLLNERYVNTMSLLLDEDKTVPIFDASGNLLSFDTRHLTPAGARFLGQLWFQHPLLNRFR